MHAKSSSWSHCTQSATKTHTCMQTDSCALSIIGPTTDVPCVPRTCFQPISPSLHLLSFVVRFRYRIHLFMVGAGSNQHRPRIDHTIFTRCSGLGRFGGFSRQARYCYAVQYMCTELGAIPRGTAGLLGSKEARVNQGAVSVSSSSY